MSENPGISAFEELVLTGILEAGPEPHELRIMYKVHELAGSSSVVLMRVRIALSLLEKEGLVYSWPADPDPKLNGMRLYRWRLQGSGHLALEAASALRGPQPLEEYFRRATRWGLIGDLWRGSRARSKRGALQEGIRTNIVQPLPHPDERGWMPDSVRSTALEIVRVQRLYKSYPTGASLGFVDLDLAQGEILGVMGPRDSGKTTLLRILCGMTDSGSGKVSVFGMDPHHHPVEARLRIGYIPKTGGLDPEMILRRFLKFVSSFYPNWDEARLRQLLAEFKIPLGLEAGSLLPDKRLKFMLAVALAHRPGLLILDEPMTSLSGPEWLEVQHLLNRISQEETAIVVSSPVSDALDDIADKVVMLDRGKVLQYGLSHELKRQYGASRLEDIFRDSSSTVSEAGSRRRI